MIMIILSLIIFCSLYKMYAEYIDLITALFIWRFT